MVVSPQQTQRQCTSCGRNIAWDANVCPYCGRDYRQQAPGAPIAPAAPMMMMAPPHPHSSLPLAGGILVIIAGAIELIVAIFLMAGGSWVTSILGSLDVFGIGGLLTAMGAIGIIVSALVIVGGYFATQRRSMAFSIVAAVLGILGGIFTFFIGSVLALIGLILMAVAHDEFT